MWCHPYFASVKIKIKHLPVESSHSDTEILNYKNYLDSKTRLQCRGRPSPVQHRTSFHRNAAKHVGLGDRRRAWVGNRPLYLRNDGSTEQTASNASQLAAAETGVDIGKNVIHFRRQ
jgi:hypothetical protein